MLEKLSKQQEALIYKHRADFIDFIVNNGKHQPQDLKLSKELREDVDWVYKKAGLDTPKFIFYSGSYLEEKLMINYIYQFLGSKSVMVQVTNQVYNQVYNQVRNQVYNQVYNQVWSQVKNQMSDQVWNQVRNQVWNQVQNQVSDQVWNQVSDQVRNQVYNQVQNQVWNQVSDQVQNQVNNQVYNQVQNQVWNQVWNQVYNQVQNQVWNQVRKEIKDKKLEWVEQGFGLPWNSGWFSFYIFFKEIGIISNPDFDKYFGTVKNHGLWSIQYFKDWCIVTQLPKVIKRDDGNRLHSIDGAAIEWRNGQKDYYIHGVYFEPELWEQVVSGLMPAVDVLKIENMEQRQAALSVISLSKILKEMDAQLISIYKKPEPKLSKKYVPDYKKLDYSKPIELYEISGDKFGIDDENIKIIHYFCPSTGREYFDYVTPEITMADAGMAWKFGISVEDYVNNLVVET